jgi:hypothetical protein
MFSSSGGLTVFGFYSPYVINGAQRGRPAVTPRYRSRTQARRSSKVAVRVQRSLRTFVLSSTDGPVEHMHMMCVGRHHLVMPVADLDRVSAPNWAAPHPRPSCSAATADTSRPTDNQGLAAAGMP